MWFAIAAWLVGAPAAHAIAHFDLSPILAPLVAFISLAVVPLNDWVTRRRIHRLSLWGAISIFAVQNVFAVMASNASWQSFVLWLAQ
jgi:NADH:ubiquinone oxidoreductase subunit H